jgi:DNA-binding PadR family transcriptional regulator
MALEHAILTALSEQPGSGYELARRFDKSLGYFWSATHQQIYRALAKMHADGWLTGATIEQDGRPDKKTYEVSAVGRGELRRWIAEATDMTPIRSDLAVKIRAARAADDPILLDDIARHRQQHVNRLDLYLSIEKHDFGDGQPLDDERLHQFLVLRGGIAAERASIGWLDEVVEALQRSRAHGRVAVAAGASA